MATFEQVESLMEQLGPVLDPLEIVGFPDQSVWGLQIDEETRLFVDYDNQYNKLVVSCDLGAPTSNDRARLYELFLQSNYTWQATGGTRLAIDSPGGNVILLVDLSPDNLTVNDFSKMLAGFSRSAQTWKEIISQPIDNSGPKEDSSDLADYAIRL